jgi:hypothetical protein
LMIAMMQNADLAHRDHREVRPKYVSPGTVPPTTRLS